MGLNDVGQMVGIMAIFVVTGLVLPFINEELGGQQEINYDIQDLNDRIGQGTNDINKASGVNAFTIFTSIISMFFYSLGELPIWLEAIFFVLRGQLAFLIGRNIWIGGGG